MAKSKSFFGLRRGSTKTLTFQVNNGKQITKDRVYEVKNPRTQAQMEQRMVMATASAAYAHMKQIVDHSFEGVTYGQMNMSEFIRVNAKAIKDSALDPANSEFSFNPYRDRNLYGGKYIMSAGTASPIPANMARAFNDGDDKTVAAFGDLTASVANLTADALFGYLGIGVGEMCTICFIAKNDTDASGIFGFVRLKAKASGTTALTTANYSDFFDVESNLPVVAGSVEGGVINFNVTTTGVVQDGEVAFCAIHSSKSNNGWLRSSAVMALNGYVLSPEHDDALATYPVGGSYVLNGGEVNG